MTDISMTDNSVSDVRADLFTGAAWYLVVILQQRWTATGTSLRIQAVYGVMPGTRFSNSFFPDKRDSRTSIFLSFLILCHYVWSFSDRLLCFHLTYFSNLSPPCANHKKSRHKHLQTILENLSQNSSVNARAGLNSHSVPLVLELPYYIFSWRVGASLAFDVATQCLQLYVPP